MKKSSGINEKLCQGKDVFERMNFLYQASQLVSQSNIPLASYYNSILVGCAKKAVLRIDHNLKRTICKVCHCPLIPGKTAKVRLMSKKKKIIKTVCCICKKAKKLQTTKNYNLWFDQPQAIIEEFEYKLPIKTRNNISATNDGVKKEDDVKACAMDQ